MSLAFEVLKQVVVMFPLMSVGFVCFKAKLLNGNGNKQLSNILLMVVTPALIINSYQMEYTKAKAVNLLLAALLAGLSLLLGILTSRVLMIRRKKSPSLATERCAVIYSNCGFMALPLIEATLGKEGVFYGSAFVIVFNLVMWTHGVYMFAGRRGGSFKETIKNILTPTVISVFLGLPIFFFGISLPPLVSDCVGYIASLNTPLAMLTAGSFIAAGNILDAFKKPRYYLVSLLRLLAVPVIAVGVYKFIPLFLPVTNDLLMSNLISTSCCSAMSAIFLSSRFGGDEEAGSALVTMTTLLCIVTIPVMVAFASAVW